MTPIEPIETLIRELEKLYEAPADSTHKDLYSKLALIELCGWLEISMDKIVEDYSATKLFEPKNQEDFKKKLLTKLTVAIINLILNRCS